MRTALLLASLSLFVACDSIDKPHTAPKEAMPGDAGNRAVTPLEDKTGAPSPQLQREAGSVPSSSQGGGTVEYYNQNIGTTATYDLDVEYDSDGDVWQINFPSGGYIGQHHITDQTHNGDGSITVTTDTGQEFTVDEEDGGNTEDVEAEQEE